MLWIWPRHDPIKLACCRDHADGGKRCARTPAKPCATSHASAELSTRQPDSPDVTAAVPDRPPAQLPRSPEPTNPSCFQWQQSFSTPTTGMPAQTHSGGATVALGSATTSGSSFLGALNSDADRADGTDVDHFAMRQHYPGVTKATMHHASGMLGLLSGREHALTAFSLTANRSWPCPKSVDAAR
jgi:hypothetical protein